MKQERGREILATHHPPRDLPIDSGPTMPNDSMGTYHGGYTVVRDGVTALNDLVTERFYEVTEQPEAAEYVQDFTYIIRNASGSRRHRVVPLLPLRRQVQNGMSIHDEAGTAIVQADSQLCARISAESARQRFNKFNKDLAELGIPKAVLRRECLEEIFCGPIFGQAERGRQNTAFAEARGELSVRIAQVVIAILNAVPATERPSIIGADAAAVYSGLVTDDERLQLILNLDMTGRQISVAVEASLEARAAQYTRDARLGIVRQLSIAAGGLELISFLQLHLSYFIPFVILAQPIGRRDDPEMPADVLLTHKGRRVPPTRLGFRQRFSRVILGRYRFFATFPLNTRAHSSHFIGECPAGLWLIGAGKRGPRADNYPHELFEQEDPTGDWKAIEATRFTFYRRQSHVERWRDHIASQTPGDYAAHQDASTLTFRFHARERGTWIISLFMFAFAIAAALQLLFPRLDLPDLHYLDAAIITGVSLAIFAFDRPVLREALIARIALAFTIILVAVVLTPSWPALAQTGHAAKEWVCGKLAATQC